MRRAAVRPDHLPAPPRHRAGAARRGRPRSRVDQWFVRAGGAVQRADARLRHRNHHRQDGDEVRPQRRGARSRPFGCGELRRAGRSRSEAAPAVPSARRRRRHRRDGAHRGGDRHRQGAVRRGDSPPQPAQGRPVHRLRLRLGPRRSDRIGAVRPRPRRISRRVDRSRAAPSRRPTAARSSSTRSASCRRRCSRRCCARIDKQSVRPVGGTSYTSASVRVVAATNRNLRADIAAKKFREDLYYRVAVIRMLVPPLRDRPEDIPLLVQHFIRQFRPDRPLAVAEEDLDRLQRHPWAGNARELRNVVERACAVSHGEQLVDRRSARGTADRAPRPPRPTSICLSRRPRPGSSTRSSAATSTRSSNGTRETSPPRRGPPRSIASICASCCASTACASRRSDVKLLDELRARFRELGREIAGGMTDSGHSAVYLRQLIRGNRSPHAQARAGPQRGPAPRSAHPRLPRHARLAASARAAPGRPRTHRHQLPAGLSGEPGRHPGLRRPHRPQGRVDRRPDRGHEDRRRRPLAGGAGRALLSETPRGTPPGATAHHAGDTGPGDLVGAARAW